MIQETGHDKKVILVDYIILFWRSTFAIFYFSCSCSFSCSFSCPYFFFYFSCTLLCQPHHSHRMQLHSLLYQSIHEPQIFCSRILVHLAGNKISLVDEIFHTVESVTNQSTTISSTHISNEYMLITRLVGQGSTTVTLCPKMLLFRNWNKFALLWGEAQLCLPYVCL